METPIEQPFEEDTDYVPLSIKVIVIWLYLLALISFFGLISFDARGIFINAISFVYGFLALWSAYGLRYKRNFARITAIVVVGLWFLLNIYMGWQALIFWKETTRIAELYIHLLGKEYTGETAIAFFILMAAMQIYTIVTLLQLKIRRLFAKPSSAIPTQK